MKVMNKIYNFFYTLFNHRKLIKYWKEEALKPFELRLNDFNAKMGQFEANFSHPLLEQTACVLAETCKNAGAVNFVTMTMYYKGDKYELTCRINDGETPSDKIKKLEDELNTLKRKTHESN